jgi:hypothetical protein
VGTIADNKRVELFGNVLVLNRDVGRWRLHRSLKNGFAARSPNSERYNSRSWAGDQGTNP